MALEKATITNLTLNKGISVLFNPEEYSLNRDINYAQIAVPGLSSPILQFVHGNMQTLEMELFLDTYEEHRNSNSILNSPGSDVRELVKQITDLMNIEPSIHAPPVLLFLWGSLSFTCVLARANQRYIMFNSNGVPVRARVQVTFNEFRNAELEAKEVKRETADYTKIYTILQGESLSAIANRVYGNPKLWRPIALANKVLNPQNLQPGARLVIPNLPYRHMETGEEFQ
ncbi:MAG: LysM peptidoglycan-binding domain-containing protein [Nitrosomonas sp.]|jgi:LysM repeat protein|uniref:CIS tube protein n=1 Tax=Nitrosomonas sp. TaxID=42353 RepID=UPI001D56ACE8|nr:LysM peptidoglycan-binding domain-containing protein [Nitrosomonas sp.]MBX9895602.1 LysM peptidoglycan-binding domain-containing protein [Nitrosomonas sp.]